MKKGQDLSESFSAEVSMFCDASREDYSGYLVFDNHYTPEGKRPVKKRMVHVLNILRTLEGQVNLMFFFRQLF